MQLKDVMTPEVEVITPEASIYEAATTMSHRDIGPLPVCDGERLVGMLTDRDITVRAVAAGRDPLTTQVRDIMTPDVVYGFEDQDVEDAARLMEQYQIRRLPVLNRSKQLVGMVALGDLAVHAGTRPVAAEVLEQVSEPGTSGRK
jgi:CBS domain-containing protein